MQKSQVSAPQNVGAATEPALTVFICANCARGGLSPTARFGPPRTPAFGWPVAAKEIVVPCTGRLQPEHLLKAFEAGAEVVGVVACEEGNCHYLEGSCRAGRRCEYVGNLLDEIGLGRKRLMMFRLPGSAREDMAAGSPTMAGGPRVPAAELAGRVGAIASQVAQRMAQLPLTPLRDRSAAPEQVEVSEVETEENDD